MVRNIRNSRLNRLAKVAALATQYHVIIRLPPLQNLWTCEIFASSYSDKLSGKEWGYHVARNIRNGRSIRLARVAALAT